MLEATCPYCWQPVEIDFDPTKAGPGEHRFVQDCDVCCHPLAITVNVEPDGSATASIERE